MDYSRTTKRRSTFPLGVLAREFLRRALVQLCRVLCKIDIGKTETCAGVGCCCAASRVREEAGFIVALEAEISAAGIYIYI